MRTPRSVPLSSISKEAVRDKYAEIYRHGEILSRRTFAGKSSLLVHLLRGRLRGAQVLDFGCGAGRFCLFASHRAASVEGLDFSDEAIAIARLLVRVTGRDNVTFRVGDLESVRPASGYDVVVVAGVLEHVPSPGGYLARLARLVRRGGLVALEVPSFSNFRGHIYMTLQTLLNLPMSLVDLHYIMPSDVSTWAQRARLEETAVYGYAYGLGWLEKSVRDMAKRVAAALKDGRMSDRDPEALVNWMRKGLPLNHALVNRLTRDGILKRIPPPPRLRLRDEQTVPLSLRSVFREYLHDDCTGDPYYCAVAPFNQMGGGTVYLLRKP